MTGAAIGVVVYGVIVIGEVICNPRATANPNYYSSAFFFGSIFAAGGHLVEAGLRYFI